MSRRTIAILIFVIGILLLSVVGILFILQQDSPPPQTDLNGEQPPVGEGTPGFATPDEAVEVRETLPPMVEVVVSLQTVQRGWQMTEAELTTDFRLASEVDDNVILNIEDAVGRYARTDIFQGQTLTSDLLVSDPTLVGLQEFGPSSLIPFGYTAAAVPMDRLSAVAYALAPGDSVDIMVSLTFVELDEEFQTLLRNSITFYLTDEEGNVIVYTVDPYGRFEALPTGDIAHISPSEPERPTKVSIILQNAKVIQVGVWTPPHPPQLPTPTPEPADEEVTPTPDFGEGQVPPTPTPAPNVLLLALPPQQQLVLKYAVEANADIDFALRGVNDGQLYTVDQLDLDYVLSRFGIVIPPNFNYSVDPILQSVTATPPPPAEEGGTP